MTDQFYIDLVKHMLTFDFPGRNSLLTQLEGLRVIKGASEDEGGAGVIELSVANGSIATTESRQPIEVESHDEDGMVIAALLFVDEGKLHLIDIYRVDSLPVKKMPPVDSFIVTSWQKTDDSTDSRIDQS